MIVPTLSVPNSKVHPAFEQIPVVGHRVSKWTMSEIAESASKSGEVTK